MPFGMLRIRLLDCAKKSYPCRSSDSTGKTELHQTGSVQLQQADLHLAGHPNKRINRTSFLPLENSSPRSTFSFIPIHCTFQHLLLSTVSQHSLLSIIIMQLQAVVLASIFALTHAQTLNIPTRVGSVVVLSSPSPISGSVDLGNKEYDRGVTCKPGDTGSDNAVFILENGATLSNVIIGANQLEGVHCKGACTLRNVWFRDVCEGRVRPVFSLVTY